MPADKVFWCLVLRMCCYNKPVFLHFTMFCQFPRTSVWSHILFRLCLINTSRFSQCLSCLHLSHQLPRIVLLLPLLNLPFPLPWFSSVVEEEEEMKIALLQRKRNQLAGYCKLVIYGVLDLTAATVVFKHYTKVERPLKNSCILLYLYYEKTRSWS